MDTYLHSSDGVRSSVIRITSANDLQAITITVDGLLAGDNIDAVKTTTDQAIVQGLPVHLYLRDVSHIDQRGRSFLSRLASQGVRLSASGVYSSYIVAGIGQESVESLERCGNRTERQNESS
jgi:hypothetical protein